MPYIGIKSEQIVNQLMSQINLVTIKVMYSWNEKIMNNLSITSQPSRKSLTHTSLDKTLDHIEVVTKDCPAEFGNLHLVGQAESSSMVQEELADIVVFAFTCFQQWRVAESGC